MTPQQSAWSAFSVFFVPLLILLLLAASSAHAQSLPFGDGQGDAATSSDDSGPEPVATDSERLRGLFAEWSDELDGIEAAITTLEQAGERSAEEIDRLAQRIAKVTVDASRAQSRAERLLERPTSALAAIGLPPKAGSSPEAEIVAEKRREWQKIRAEIAAEITFSRLISARAEGLVNRLAITTEQTFFDWLLKKEPVALDAAFWSKPVELLFKAGNLEPIDVVSTTGLERGVFVVIIAVAALILIVLLFAIRPRIEAKMRAREEEENPGQRAKANAAMQLAVFRGALPAALVLCLALIILPLDFLPGEIVVVSSSLLLGIAFHLAYSRICRVGLAPFNPRWRVVGIEDRTARNLHRGLYLGSALAGVFIALHVLTLSSDILSDSGRLILEFVAILVTGAFLLALLRDLTWISFVFPQRASRTMIAIRIGSAAIVLAIMAPCFWGYVNFSFFILVHLLGTGLLILGGYFVRPLLHAGIRVGFSDGEADFESQEHSLLETFLHLLLDVSVVLVFAFCLLVLWGAPVQVLSIAVAQATADFSFGKTTIGIGDLAAAIFAFVVALIALRFFRDTLRTRVLQRLSMDHGVLESIDSGLGYVGFAVAFMSAIAVLGVSLSSIAILLGALLLGVGFGLQNVVDNFVCGLILLVQRPIKSGDWISIESYEGLVKRVGVISTEISTFEEASVIVPNSELISSPVVNRTLGLNRGRVDIRIGVAYDTDLSVARSALLECASDNGAVLDHPEPELLLLEFNDSALDLELRVFIPDIRDSFSVASDLRLSILESLREHGVEIPYPQQDLHIRTVAASDVDADDAKVVSPPLEKRKT